MWVCILYSVWKWTQTTFLLKVVPLIEEIHLRISFDNLSTIRWCSLLAQTTSKPSLRPTHARFSTQKSSTPPLFSPQHPIVILKDVAFEDLQTVVKFMYHGIVNVSSDKLPAVLKVIYRERFFSFNVLSPDCGCVADKRPGKEQWADGSLPHWQVAKLLFWALVT